MILETNVRARDWAEHRCVPVATLLSEGDILGPAVFKRPVEV